MIHAQLSPSALVANARAAGVAGAVVDLRRDAWGHGIRFALPVLADCAVGGVIVDERDHSAAVEAGVEMTDAAATVDGRHLFGLPGPSGAPGDPVMTARSRVLSLKTLRRGEGVSYGYTHRATEDTRIALVSGGYGQGVLRALGNRVSVEIAGDLHPVVGRVAMDVFVVDIGAAAVASGDEVVLFGGDGAAKDAVRSWVAATGLDAAELVCAIGLRAHREVAA
ncbi:alanine racemase C-terminal domain-containing protein [Microbacterium sp. SLBN-146]|uniref:alanine racemase C-terminal domain-containing protein n=1 Tax=Microbacterium sp. SLBN-146 TaxID=2768457 RepID=UPI0011522D69|nr:alanine racemase C-terminal domain-containing protein [Microbacterium sp. SLBN-146]TQJ29801.1 alanine racemase [Microbacterium sp. SLBN-146]